MKQWTDYPFESLGDIAGKRAPIRPIQVLSFDGNKYCKVLVEGVVEWIKCGYIYQRAGRCGEVPTIKTRALKKLMGSTE